MSLKWSNDSIQGKHGAKPERKVIYVKTKIGFGGRVLEAIQRWENRGWRFKCWMVIADKHSGTHKTKVVFEKDKSRDESGQAALEFAIVAMLVVAILLFAWLGITTAQMIFAPLFHVLH